MALCDSLLSCGAFPCPSRLCKLATGLMGCAGPGGVHIPGAFPRLLLPLRPAALNPAVGRSVFSFA